MGAPPRPDPAKLSGAALQSSARRLMAWRRQQFQEARTADPGILDGEEPIGVKLALVWGTPNKSRLENILLNPDGDSLTGTLYALHLVAIYRLPGRIYLLSVGSLREGRIVAEATLDKLSLIVPTPSWGRGSDLGDLKRAATDLQLQLAEVEKI